MKKSYKTFVYALLFMVLHCLPAVVSAQVTFQIEYPTSVVQSGRDVLPTSDGGYLIVGMTKPTPTDTDIYLMKTDYAGSILWTRSFGGAGQEYPYAMLQTNDGNYFVIGYTTSYGAGKNDTWLLKIDPAGNLLWAQTYGGAEDDFGKAIVSTADGNYAITGRSNSINPANTDAYLMKIDPLGNPIWTKYYGGAQYETSHSLQQCLDGGYIILGQTYSSGQGSGDIYMVKTDGAGNALWTKTYGGTGMDDGNWVLTNSDGTYIICAESNSVPTLSVGDYDVLVIKTDANGDSLWSRKYGGNQKDVSHMIQHTSDGGYVIAAISRSFGSPNPDMWVVKIDVSGSIMWTQRYGSWDHEHCYAVKQTSDGGYVVLGHTLSYSPNEQIMFIKTDANGTVGREEYAGGKNLNVYPNPTNGIINIRFNIQANETCTIKISNALGQVLFSEEASGLTKNKIIDLKDKERGMYFVSVGSGESITTKKVILE